MIEFRTRADDHPDLQHSPLLRAEHLTLNYALEHGAIPISKTKAFKRVFVHWAVEDVGFLHSLRRKEPLQSGLIGGFSGWLFLEWRNRREPFCTSDIPPSGKVDVVPPMHVQKAKRK